MTALGHLVLLLGWGILGLGTAVYYQSGRPAVRDCPFCKGEGCPSCGGGHVDDRELREVTR